MENEIALSGQTTQLTEKAVARPDEEALYRDFQSRSDWFRDWIQKETAKNPDFERKRKGFVQLFFLKKTHGYLDCISELVPPEDILNHCDMIRKYYLENGGYFKWVPTLEKQFATAGVKIDVPESLVEERSWRLAAENNRKSDKYLNDDKLQRIPESGWEGPEQADS